MQPDQLRRVRFGLVTRRDQRTPLQRQVSNFAANQSNTSDRTMIAIFAFVGIFGALALGFRYGERDGYIRGRMHGYDLMAVEHMQADWRRCDRRCDRIRARKNAR